MPSTSERQRRFMGMTLAYKRGESRGASPEVRKAARSMSTQQLRDFAKKSKRTSKRSKARRRR